MPKWCWILIIVLILVYLNRAYAYFYDFLGAHQIMPPTSNSIIKLKASQAGAKGKFQYVALGDSLTWGEGVDDSSQTFPYQIAQVLAYDQDVELSNFGIPGAKTQDLIKTQLPKLKDLKPNLITLLIGVNDAQTTDTEDTFKQNYQQILDQITTDPGVKVVVVNIPALTNSKVMLPPFKNLMDLRINSFNSIIKTLVSKKQENFNNLVFINLCDATKQQFEEDPSLYSADYFHPSAKGYKLWSQIINANINY